MSHPQRFCRIPLSLLVALALFSIVWFGVNDGFAPRSAKAHVVGTLPLSTRDWHDSWELDPSLALPDPSRWDRVVSLYLSGDLNAIVAELTSMLAEGFDEETVRRNLAVVYKDLGEYRLAAAEYERLAALSPDDAHVKGDWGFALLGAGDSEGAVSRFGEALALDDHEPMIHFGLGLAHYLRGENHLAVQALTQAVMIDPRLAVAYELLGNIHLQEGRFQAASTALERAVRLDSSYLLAYYRLAQAYEAQGRILDAWSYYDRSRRILSTRADVQQDVARFVEAYRPIILAREQERVDARRRVSHVRVEPLEVPEDTPMIRVGLLERSAGFTFSAGAPFRLEAVDAESGPLLAAGEKAAGGDMAGVYAAGEWRVVRDEQGILLEGPHGEALRLGRRDVRLTPIDPAATMILYDLESGQGYFWSTREDLQVRGSLEFLHREAGLTIVNLLDLESYLLAVVPSEMYPGMDLEALKAQAIAARTYTLRSRGRYRSRGFDVLGTVSSSAYRGVNREHPATTAAVIATLGQVLTYRGSLAETLYSSSAGGYTASSEEVWGGARAYLRAVPEWDAAEAGPNFPLGPSALEGWLKHIPDVYSSRSTIGLLSTFRWVQRVEAGEIQRRVGRVASIGEVLKIIPGSRGIGGYVNRVTLVGTKGSHVVRGDSIRSTLGGLKSNAFKVEAVVGADGLPESFIFYGAGFGHGVGLSQFGAAGMAEAGMTVDEILGHYFPGAVIRPNYNR